MRCPKECSKGKKPIVVTKLPKLGSEEREKRIVAPKLPKMGGKKNCDNQVAENGRKKNCSN